MTACIYTTLISLCSSVIIGAGLQLNSIVLANSGLVEQVIYSYTGLHCMHGVQK